MERIKYILVDSGWRGAASRKWWSKQKDTWIISKYIDDHVVELSKEELVHLGYNYERVVALNREQLEDCLRALNESR